MTSGPERRLPLAAFAVALGLAVLAAVMLWDAAGLRQTGGYSGVGPETVPRIVAFGLIGLSVWTVVAALRGHWTPAPPQDRVALVWLLGSLVLLLATLHTAGFVLSAALLFTGTARAFGQRNMALSFGIGILLTTVIYVVFDRLLRLNLPAGPIERALFGG